jgi:DNA-binding NarL/FixJ family response regulator
MEMGNLEIDQSGISFSIVGTVKAAILDEQPLFRLGLATFLRKILGFSIAIETGDYAGFLSETKEHETNLIIMDIAFDGQSNIEIIRELRNRFYAHPILVLSDFEETVFAKQVVRAGANGYIMKSSDQETVREAVLAVLDGKTYLSERVYNILLEEVMNQQTLTAESGVDKLSSREFQVFLLMGKGLQPKEITDSLRLSRGTVEYDRKIMLRKLNLMNLKQLRDYALSWVRTNKIN